MRKFIGEFVRTISMAYCLYYVVGTAGLAACARFNPELISSYEVGSSQVYSMPGGICVTARADLIRQPDLQDFLKYCL